MRRKMRRQFVRAAGLLRKFEVMKSDLEHQGLTSISAGVGLCINALNDSIPQADKDERLLEAIDLVCLNCSGVEHDCDSCRVYDMANRINERTCHE